MKLLKFYLTVKVVTDKGEFTFDDLLTNGTIEHPIQPSEIFFVLLDWINRHFNTKYTTHENS